LDNLARKHLWDARDDYKHSTSHGVSFCGPVHEHPNYVASKNIANALPLQEGMVITNEPGCYKQGQYGIRIENMMAVEKDQSSA
jgi:Xaa-Pro aminopeptidase